LPQLDDHRDDPDYPMGTLETERQRLRDQDEVFAPHSENFFTMAGITAGMRVLDIGCGVGATTGLLASIVGPTGSVVGVDRDPASLDRAVRWMTERGLKNVEFRQSNLPDLDLTGQFDAIAGRIVLAYLTNPAAVLRMLCRYLVPGGVITFQEMVISQVRAIPEVPMWSQTRDWVIAGLRLGGAEPDMGDRLPETFRAAGLTDFAMASATPLLSVETALPGVGVRAASAVAPLLVKAGVVAEGEIDADRLTHEVIAQARAVQAMLYYVQLNAAWANLPGH
jgi:SAM-dependent methyltransferase